MKHKMITAFALALSMNASIAQPAMQLRLDTNLICGRIVPRTAVEAWQAKSKGKSFSVPRGYIGQREEPFVSWTVDNTLNKAPNLEVAVQQAMKVCKANIEASLSRHYGGLPNGPELLK